jgi:hypothetical protein
LGDVFVEAGRYDARSALIVHDDPPFESRRVAWHFGIAQLHWFLQDYQQNAFGIGAPTETVQALSGSPPEDFETIVRRYVAFCPFATRGLASAMREAAVLAAALLARTPRVSTIESRLGVPCISNATPAADSLAWRTKHA